MGDPTTVFMISPNQLLANNQLNRKLIGVVLITALFPFPVTFVLHKTRIRIIESSLISMMTHPPP